MPLNLAISAAGDTIGDLQDALDEIKDKLDNGFTSGFDSGDGARGYNWSLEGEETPVYMALALDETVGETLDGASNDHEALRQGIELYGDRLSLVTLEVDAAPEGDSIRTIYDRDLTGEDVPIDRRQSLERLLEDDALKALTPYTA